MGADNRVRSSKEDDGRIQEEGAPLFAFGFVVSFPERAGETREGMGERACGASELVKRNNARKITLLPVKREIYLRMCGKICLHFTRHNIISPGGAIP